MLPKTQANIAKEIFLQVKDTKEHLKLLFTHTYHVWINCVKTVKWLAGLNLSLPPPSSRTICLSYSEYRNFFNLWYNNLNFNFAQPKATDIKNIQLPSCPINTISWKPTTTRFNRQPASQVRAVFFHLYKTNIYIYIVYLKANLVKFSRKDIANPLPGACWHNI